MDESQVGFDCVKVAEFRYRGRLCIILANLSYERSPQFSVPSSAGLKLLVDGNVEDTLQFLLDWRQFPYTRDGKDLSPDLTKGDCQQESHTP